MTGVLGEKPQPHRTLEANRYTIPGARGRRGDHFNARVRSERDKTRPSLAAHSLRGSPRISRRMAVTAALHLPSPALCTPTCAPAHLPPRPSACTILAYTRLCAHMFTDAGRAFSGAQVQRYGYGHRLQLHRAQKKKLSVADTQNSTQRNEEEKKKKR